MEKLISFVNEILNLSSEKQVFVIALLAIVVTGFALYVILAVIKSDFGGKED